MRRVVKLNERDFSRIVKRTINEMKDLPQAMNFLDTYLEETGGTMGARSEEEIMMSLEALERAIKMEKGRLGVSMERPNPKFSQKDEMMESRRRRRF